MLTQFRWWTSSSTLQMSYPMSPSRSASPSYTPSTLSKGIRNSCPSPWPADKKPSKLICFLFKGSFLYHLPPNIRTHLMREDISDPHKLVAKADKIWQSSSARSVNAVSATSPVSDDSVKSLRQRPQPRPASLVAPIPAPCPARPSSSSTTSDLCWYYRKHGDQAHHCRTPCTWDQGN